MLFSYHFSRDREGRDKALAADSVLTGRKLAVTREEFLAKSKALRNIDNTKGHEGRYLVNVWVFKLGGGITAE